MASLALINGILLGAVVNKWKERCAYFRRKNQITENNWNTMCGSRKSNDYNIYKYKYKSYGPNSNTLTLVYITHIAYNRARWRPERDAEKPKPKKEKRRRPYLRTHTVAVGACTIDTNAVPTREEPSPAHVRTGHHFQLLFGHLFFFTLCLFPNLLSVLCELLENEKRRAHRRHRPKLG